MKSRVLLFFIAMIVWLGLTGSVDWRSVLLGILVSVLVSILIGDMFVQRPGVIAHPSRYVWFAYYIPFFLYECLKANIDVAYRVIHPKLPVHPGIVKVKTTLKSDTGLTFLANSITLTPGTMTIDVDKERGYLYIHWIDVKVQDIEGATKKIVERFERILKRIFE